MLYKQIQDQFSEEVEKIAEKSGSYIDHVLQLCDKHNIEPQVAAKIISRPIKEKRLNRRVVIQIFFPA